MQTTVLVLVSRLYMYCKIVKLGVYVYHTRDMWMGPKSQVWDWIFFLSFSNGTYCFPFIFCAIYLLVNADHLHFFFFCIFVAKWWTGRLLLCQHHYLSWCWSHWWIKKSAGTDRNWIWSHSVLFCGENPHHFSLNWPTKIGQLMSCNQFENDSFLKMCHNGQIMDVGWSG